MEPSRKNDKTRSVFDVEKDGKGHPIYGRNVLNLRPRFRVRHPVIALLMVAGVGLIVFLTARQFFTRAETKDYFPVTCLGDWQNTGNAGGKPETLSGSVGFNEANSATEGASSSQILCGGFVPPNDDASGDIKNVGLTLVWQIGDQALSQYVITAPSASSTNASSTETASSTEVTSSTSEASTTEILSGSASSTSDASSNVSSSVATPSSTVPIATPSSTASTAPTTPTTSTTPVDTSTTEPSLTPSPAQVPAPAPTDSVATSSAFRWFPISIAFAEEGTTTDSSTDSSTVVIGPPLEAVLQPAASGTASSSPSGEASGTDATASGTVPLAPPEVPDGNFLKVSYRTDGQTWITLARVGGNTWQNFTATLPVLSWNDLKKLQVKIEGIPTTLTELPKVYLDGMFVEVHYDIPPAVALIPNAAPGAGNASAPAPIAPAAPSAASAPSVISLPPSDKPVPVNQSGNFKANESPSFDFDLNALPAPTSTAPSSTMPVPTQSSTSPTSFLEPASRLFSFFLSRVGLVKGPAEAQTIPQNPLPDAGNPVIANIIGPDGKLTDLQPAILTTGGTLRVTLPNPGRSFMPGRYALKLFIWKNGVIYSTENDFSWGVLAVNFNKSVYAKGDTATASFGLLTSQGHTVCNGDITMELMSPSGKHLYFSTTNGSIARNATCGPQTVTNEPDYSATFEVREVGTYQASITAWDPVTRNSIATNDNFSAQDAPAFSVERVEATRIYPPATYEVTLKIIPAADYSGSIAEVVPDSFQIVTEAPAEKSFNGGDQTITWQVSLKAGVETDLKYTFKAPDISPELYRTGPLRIGTWAETRQWQIAADAAGDVILMWAGTQASIPTGWTCISCATSDPFYNVYPRASSTYGNASSGANVVAPTLTYASQSENGTVTSANVRSGNPTTESMEPHTHSWPNPSVPAIDIRPLTQNLLFIKANTTTLPSGVIGMFDVAATSSLPSGWSYFQGIDSKYLGGSNTSSTVGTTTPTFTVGAVTSGAPSTTSISVSASTGNTFSSASHTHVIATSSLALTNVPPTIGVVFAQLSGAASIPSGLIAMFDNTSLQSNWSIISTSGSPFAGNLLIGTSSFTGAAFGVATSSLGGSVVLTSGSVGNATNIKTTPASVILPNLNHTHSVTYNISTINITPVYRDVILGKYSLSNQPPSVTSVKLNGAAAITLTPNTTTTILVTASTTDPNGAGDIRYATGTIYRTSLGNSCTSNNLNCYRIASSGCSFSGSTSTVTCSADIWYFAQSTGNASSSFPSDSWTGAITVTDSANNTSTATSSVQNINVLTAINITTSSINFGLVSPSSTVGGNITSTIQNAGNSSTTIQISGTALVNGGIPIATSSMHYASTSFTYGGSEQQLQSTPALVSGFILTAPTSTSAVQNNVFWGFGVPPGLPTGTYNGTTTISAVYSQ